MLAILLLALAAAPLPARAGRGTVAATIPADGRVVTPEGIRFQLPPRLSYSVRQKDGQRVYAARSADGTTLVAVSAFASDSELPCEADQEGVEVDAFETARGLGACRIVGGADDEPLGLALVYLRLGRTFVTVTVIAARGAAAELATTTAESVDVALLRAGVARGLTKLELPRREPRLIGCFRHERGVAGAVFVRKRCFEEDFSFSDAWKGGIPGSPPIIKEGEQTGEWLYAEGSLLMRFDDATELELEVRFEGEDLYLDGVHWERL